MTRLIADRYVPAGAGLLRDLATGDTVSDAGAGTAVDEPPMAPLLELLDHGEEGTPRWIVVDARSPDAAVRAARRAARDAQSRGFVPIAVAVFPHACEALDATLKDRALLLIAGPRDSERRARHALLTAASASPRPHALLSIRTRPGAGGASLVREARAVYGEAVRRPVRVVPIDSEAERHRQRALRAREFVLAGRHAAAERLLRDVAAALMRRRHEPHAAAIWIELGQLLLERGRPAEADTVFETAATLVATRPDERLLLLARTWQAAARIDAGRLSEAEALCRAALASARSGSGVGAFAQATLARALLWQGRTSEAAALDLRVPADNDLDGLASCVVAATAVDVALADERLFVAGGLARELLTQTEGAEPLPRQLAATAHLRVLAALGDHELVASAFRTAVALARTARTPLRAVTARLLYAAYLHAAGLLSDARREHRRLERLTAAAPALLARAVRDLGVRLAAPHPARVPGAVVRDAPVAIELIAAAQDQEDDRDAVRGVLEHVAARLRTSRIDLVSADAGPATAILSVGTGLHTCLGERVLQAGIALGPETARGGTELGVPLRRGHAIVAGVVARWPVDRQPAEGAAHLLDLAAAVVRPRVEAMQTAARAEARTATLLPEFVGASAAMAEVRATIARAAAAPFAVLLHGESGVGKELAARAIHQLSPRRERRFCDLNCAALPEELLDSELFGHARGAFTGALTDRAGLFEDADGGTVFLDEIADLSARGQAKLLRVVQQQEVRRVGETFARKVDVRIVTAANRDMHAEVAAGRFREDLLYRLDVIRLRIPPLRERPDDVPLLAQHFWGTLAARVGTSASLTQGVMAALSRYHWPGNVRELQNVMAALAVAAPSRGHVRASLLPAAIAGAGGLATTRLAEARAHLERRMVESALARAGGSRTRAARELGLSRQGLLKMMGRLGVR